MEKVRHFRSGQVKMYYSTLSTTILLSLAFRDSRAVDETIQYMMDNPVAHYDWLIPGLDIGPYSWDIFAGADVSTTLENKKNETQALLDQMNN